MQNKNLKLKLGLCGLALTSFLALNAHSVVHADTVQNNTANNNAITWDSDSDDSQVVKEEPEQQTAPQSVQKQSTVQASQAQPVQTKKVMVSDVSSVSALQKRAETSNLRQSNVQTSTVNRLNANKSHSIKVSNVQDVAQAPVQKQKVAQFNQGSKIYTLNGSNQLSKNNGDGYVITNAGKYNGRAVDIGVTINGVQDNQGTYTTKWSNGDKADVTGKIDASFKYQNSVLTGTQQNNVALPNKTRQGQGMVNKQQTYDGFWMIDGAYLRYYNPDTNIVSSDPRSHAALVLDPRLVYSIMEKNNCSEIDAVKMLTMVGVDPNQHDNMPNQSLYSSNFWHDSETLPIIRDSSTYHYYPTWAIRSYSSWEGLSPYSDRPELKTLTNREVIYDVLDDYKSQDSEKTNTVYGNGVSDDYISAWTHYANRAAATAKSMPVLDDAYVDYYGHEVTKNGHVDANDDKTSTTLGIYHFKFDKPQKNLADAIRINDFNTSYKDNIVGSLASTLMILTEGPDWDDGPVPTYNYIVHYQKGTNWANNWTKKSIKAYNDFITDPHHQYLYLYERQYNKDNIADRPVDTSLSQKDVTPSQRTITDLMPHLTSDYVDKFTEKGTVTDHLQLDKTTPANLNYDYTVGLYDAQTGDLITDLKPEYKSKAGKSATNQDTVMNNAIKTKIQAINANKANSAYTGTVANDDVAFYKETRAVNPQDQALHKSATRIISVNLPNDPAVKDRYKGILNSNNQIVQTINFTRTGTENVVSGQVTYGAWTGPSSFGAVTLPDIPGYTMTMS